MPSLFLGKVGSEEHLFEIHAVTNQMPFREHAVHSISDPSLYSKILEDRYKLLNRGSAIYCTAINPNPEKKIEYNPHDDRPGTFHLVAIDKNGEIEAAVSLAVDIGDKDNGEYIGVPLENRWKRGAFPLGDNLDDFRKNYFIKRYHQHRHVKPYEMTEFYRHFKRFGAHNTCARLALYSGAYNLLVRQAIKKQLTPTTLWVFDAIPQYFNLYRYAGAAILRNLILDNEPRFLSPSKRNLHRIQNNGSSYISYSGMKVSRDVIVPVPFVGKNGEILFENKTIPFLDGVVDMNTLEEAVKTDPDNLTPLHFSGFTEHDKRYLNETLGILMRQAYQRPKPLPKDKNGIPISWDFQTEANA